VDAKPDVVLLTEADWSNVPQEDTNHAGDAANYMPDGWTFTGSKLYLDGGFISPSRSSSITVNTDFAGYSKVSVIINAKSYTKGTNSTLTVSTDLGSETIVLAKELDTYLVVLEMGDNPFVKFTAGNYPELQSIKIYGGEIIDPEPFSFRANETGDASNRLIEGITPDKFYTVTGLLPATSYLYRVKAIYVNGTESLWSSYKEVLLKEGGETLPGDVNGDGKVSIDDVTDLIDFLLGADNVDPNAADVNSDGKVSIDDVTDLIDLLLTAE
jgi:hypothetical protein